MTRLIISVFIVMGLALSGGIQLPRVAGEVSFVGEAEAAPPKPRKPPKSKPAKPLKKKPSFKQKPNVSLKLPKGQKVTMKPGSVKPILSGARFPNAKLWSLGSVGNAAKNALGHWQKHRSDFPQLTNAVQYMRFAKTFLHSPPAGTFTKIRANGDILRYNQQTNIYGVMTSNGTPKTLFKPKEGTKYWKTK